MMQPRILRSLGARAGRARCLAALLFAILGVGSGCIGHWVDERCIKGKLSEEQAAAINDEAWGHLPDYNQDAEGKCIHCAKARDRILAEECSELLKHPSREL